MYTFCSSFCCLTLQMYECFWNIKEKNIFFCKNLDVYIVVFNCIFMLKISHYFPLNFIVFIYLNWLILVV